MKFRIIASILLIVVLTAVYVIVAGSNSSKPAPSQDSGFAIH